jgi:hypothetical protein
LLANGRVAIESSHREQARSYAPLLTVISDNEHPNQIMSFSVWRCCSSAA